MSEWTRWLGDWWLQRLSGTPAVPGEGVETTFAHTWPGPPWLTLLTWLFLFVVIVMIYVRESAPSRSRLLLIALRLAAVSLILFMIYGWVRHRHRTELPDLVVAIDVSESMSVADQYEDPRLLQAIRQLVRVPEAQPNSRVELATALLTDDRHGWLPQLQRHYRVKLFQIGESARALNLSSENAAVGQRLELQAAEPASRLGASLLEILRAQRGHSTAAVIVLTDGNTTEGEPLSEAAAYAAQKSIPLFLVGLGSEQPPRDVRLSDLLAEDVAFLGDVISFDLKLHSQGFTDREAVVRLRRQGSETVLAEQTVRLPEDRVALPVRLSYRPLQEGDWEFEIDVEPQAEENQRDNNRLTQTVAVRNATIRVLFVQGSPSYEYRFLKNLLSRGVHRGEASQRAVELTTVLQEVDPGFTAQDVTAAKVLPEQREELFTYDLIILGDCNPAFFSRSAMQNLADFVTQRGGGIVFLAGPNFMPLEFNDTPLTPLLPFDLTTTTAPAAETLAGPGFRVQPTAVGWENPILQLGDSPAETRALWSQLPEVRWLLEISDVNTHALTLAEHPTRRALSGAKLPVLLLQFVGAGKVMFLATDETYLWSRHLGSEEHYARFWLQLLRYLSRSKLLSDTVPVTLATDATKYLHGDPVRLRVQFRDERLAPAADDGVTVRLEDRQGKWRPVVLTRTSGNRGLFEAEVTDLEVGTHRAILATPALTQAPQPQRFTIESSRSELSRLEMNSAELLEAAKVSDGRFYTLRSAARLVHDLPRGDQIRIEPLPAEPIWNSSWIAALFVLLVGTEWVLRRRAGLL